MTTLNLKESSSPTFLHTMSSITTPRRQIRFKPTPLPSSPATVTPVRSNSRRTPSESAELDEQDQSSNSSDAEDDSGDIIMAVDQRSQKLGCSYYTISTGTLSLMEDISMPNSEMLMTRGFHVPHWKFKLTRYSQVPNRTHRNPSHLKTRRCLPEKYRSRYYSNLNPSCIRFLT